MKTKKDLWSRIANFLQNNLVTIMFIIICIIC